MSNPAFAFDHVHLISPAPKAAAEWYVEMFGAVIKRESETRGAPQIFVEIGGMTVIIRGQRPGEEPSDPKPVTQYKDYSSHNEWGTDHFGFMYKGDLASFCKELRGKGVTFPVELKNFNGNTLCYVAAPDGVSIELMQC
jgi:catechol 2,3-dioxygenase-like lactoylglutathione lyase family enzyme|tara:strand:- start:131 stop:547 length:417 start_codon:yes stop_codon:yes gene_type:complete